MSRFSIKIRYRLLFLIITIVALLSVQYFIISETNSISIQVNEKSLEYALLDTEVNDRLIEVKTGIREFSNFHLDRIIDHLVFDYDATVDLIDSPIDYVDEALSDLTELLQERQFNNYAFNLDVNVIIRETLLNKTQFDISKDIIDKNETGVWNLALEFEPETEKRLIALNNLVRPVRNFYKASSDAYVSLADSLRDSNNGLMDRMNDQFEIVWDNLNYTNFGGNVADLEYALNMDQLFNQLYKVISEMYITWAESEVIGFGLDEFDPEFLNDSIDAMYEKVDSLNTSFTEISNTIANTPGIQINETDSLGNITAIWYNSMQPTFTQLTFQMVNIQEAISDLEQIRLVDLKVLKFSIDNDIQEILDLFKAEILVFEQYLQDLSVYLADLINTSVNSFTLIIIAIVSVSLVLLSITLLVAFRNINQKFDQVTKGNLDIKTKKRYSGTEIGEMEKGFDELVTQLKSTLGLVQSTSEMLSGIAEELAAGSEEASASIREVSDTMKEFAGGASEQNIMLSRISEKLVEHMYNVQRSSERIGETSNFVLKVAKRTNILGLNASIEAAKAGRYGRGFSIVAREVRNLSNTTKSSANEIANIIDEVQITINESIQQIQREVQIVGEVSENTAAGSEEVSAATMEQVTMLSEISDTSNQLSDLAQELNNLLQRFTIE